MRASPLLYLYSVLLSANFGELCKRRILSKMDCIRSRNVVNCR